MKLRPFEVLTATVTSKGQITLPKALCTRIGIQRGDTFIFGVENGRIVAQHVKRHDTVETPTR